MNGHIGQSVWKWCTRFLGRNRYTVKARFDGDGVRSAPPGRNFTCRDAGERGLNQTAQECKPRHPVRGPNLANRALQKIALRGIAGDQIAKDHLDHGPHRAVGWILGQCADAIDQGAVATQSSDWSKRRRGEWEK